MCSSYLIDSAYSYATRYGPGRHDGAAVMRVTKYDEGCTCFVYADNSLMPLP